MQKTYIMLGRTGDVLNLLPVLEYEGQKNNYKPRLVVAKDYADVLDGVDYVEKVSFYGDYKEIFQAIIFAQKQFPNDEIVNCAVYGKNYSFKRKCSSFLREAWRLAGAPVAWGSLPLNITNRSEERKQDLLNYFNIQEDKKPIILTALNGTSSPLACKDELSKYLNKRLSDEFRIIDISDAKTYRIYDLLALYERARCLIAIDSAPLHLAHAIPKSPPELPVVSLISDLKDEWHQSSWRPNHILRVLYSEVPNKMEEIANASEEGFTYETPVIRLVTSSLQNPDAETKRRKDFALASWFKERIQAGSGRWHYDFYQRINVPKVKDMIDYVCDKAKTNDILMITNSDINFVHGITGWILHEVMRHGAVYFHRHDFQRLDEHFVSEAQVTDGKWYPGSDTFAFTRKWWTENREIFPDMYFAREAWDMVMRNMIKRSGGAEIHSAIYHEKHTSFWETTENRNVKENLHNRSLAKHWLNIFGGDWNDWKFKTLVYK